MRQQQSRCVLSKGSFRIEDEHREIFREATRAGLAETPAAAMRDLLTAATELQVFPELKGKNTEEIIMSESTIPWPVKVAALRRANPGMSFREACSELGKRSRSKQNAGKLNPATTGKKARDWQRAQEALEEERARERERFAAESEAEGLPAKPATTSAQEGVAS